MSRRGSQDEPDFGSDSFLDIIANLVGILIILIVLAGLRASETVEMAEDGREAEALTEEPKPQPDEDPEAERATALAEESERQAKLDYEAERRRRLSAIEEASRLAALSDVARNRVAQLDGKVRRPAANEAEAAAARAKQERNEADAAMRVLLAAQQRLDAEQAQAKTQAGLQAAELNALARQLDEVNRELAKRSDSKSAKEQLAHRVSPVGQVVLGDEIHFRISEGKISHVPIEELTSILREKIQQNGSWLIKYNRHAGKIGPVEGFQLDYVVEREVMSTVDALRAGPGAIKIALSEFVIRPTEGIEEAAVENAIRRDGLVWRRLSALPPGSAVTLWVYPDSFSEYREVASFAQRNGFIVAGRPLPKGMPIAGSPEGSKSVAQ
ncbi:MAG: hypothetical protein O2820_02835 [Planctomycetota bacterium]|nr:hypothetical protein [Planctomycetota bacterium]MDA1248138.1 hypothetical protein [Planctomycetota bacterium]